MKLIKWKPILSNLDVLNKINCDFYFVNYPTDYWHKKNNLTITNNYSIKKKNDFCKILNVKYLFSPTENDNVFITNTCIERHCKTKVLHVGSRLKSKRFNQLSKMFKIFLFLLKLSNKKNNSSICIYNVDLVYIPLYLFLKILGFRLVLQLEDNYLLYYDDTIIRKSLYKFTYNLFDIIISSNKNNFSYFKNEQQKIHYNGFVNFNSEPFLNDILFPKFVFGGTVNELRGSNILNGLINYLYKNYNKFELHITGTTLDVNDKNVFVHGFLETKEYVKLLQNCDYGLVLQSESGLGEGFFPSKTLDYNENGLLILTLEL